MMTIRHRSYRQMSAPVSDWIGALPVHWRVKRLKDVADFNPESLREDAAQELEITYIDIGGVDGLGWIADSEVLTFANAPTRARRVVRDGDVIISTVRTYLRAIAAIRCPAPDTIVSTGFAVVRPRNELSTEFTAYALRAPYFVDRVVAGSKGVSFPAISDREMSTYELAIPPLAEQRAIASFLDRETAKIDALMTQKERLIELLGEKRAALVTRAVTKGLEPSVPMKGSGVDWLGEVPAHWNPRKIKNLYRRVKRQNHAEEIVLSVYRDHGVIEKASRDDNFNRTPADLESYQLVNPNDLVINKMKAWQGSLGVSALTGITSPDYLVFCPLHSEDSRYLHHVLRSKLLAKVYHAISNGIRPSQWRLEPEKFQDLVVFLPPGEEQREIVGVLDREGAKIDALITRIRTAIDHLHELRTALISAAVTGKIDVREEVA